MSCEFEELKALILQTKADIIETIQTTAIKNEHAAAVRWIKKYIKTNGYISWSKVKDDPGFLNTVKANNKFHRIMRAYMDICDWDTTTMEGVTFYHAKGFDIDGVVKNLSWQNFKPQDSKFLEMLIKDVIVKAAGETVNIYKWLGEHYPQKSDQWCEDANVALKDRVLTYYKGKIKFDGDDFWIVT